MSGELRYPFSEIKIGFSAPFEALRYLLKNKMWLMLCLGLHLAAFAAYLWAIGQWVVPWVGIWVTRLSSEPNPGILADVLATLAVVSLYVTAFIFYAFLALPVLNVLASPLFDLLATKTLREVSSLPIARQGLSDFVRSLGFEVVKLLVLTGVLALGIVAQFLVVLLPLALLFSIWFAGWEHIDRSLGLVGLPVRKRLTYGLLHCVACCSLGVWVAVPFLGTLMAFGMVVAGAQVVASIPPRLSDSESRES